MIIVRKRVLFGAYNAIMKKPKLFGKMLALDFFFLIILYYSSKLSGAIIPKDTYSIAYSKFGIPFLLTFSALFFLFIIFAYSFFKYLIMGLVASLFGQVEQKLRRLDKLFIISIIN